VLREKEGMKEMKNKNKAGKRYKMVMPLKAF
jgi:hypothetical protein